MRRLIDGFRRHSRMALLGLLIIAVWRIWGSIPQPYVDQAQLA